jgi:6-pyruvoyltetrahydropterin/6-carboxytetrahydropterin synthase
MSYKIHTEATISAAHHLPFYKGKCKDIHGHNFRVTVDVYAKELQREGSCTSMVIDFSEIKKAIMKYDHKDLNDVMFLGFHRVIEYQPTAELLATEIAHNVAGASNSKVVVRVYETEKNYAEFTYDPEE